MFAPVVDRDSGAPIEPVLVDAATGNRLDPRRTRVAYGDVENWGRPRTDDGRD